MFGFCVGGSFFLLVKTLFLLIRIAYGAILMQCTPRVVLFGIILYNGFCFVIWKYFIKAEKYCIMVAAFRNYGVYYARIL